MYTVIIDHVPRCVDYFLLTGFQVVLNYAANRSTLNFCIAQEFLSILTFESCICLFCIWEMILSLQTHWLIQVFTTCLLHDFFDTKFCLQEFCAVYSVTATWSLMNSFKHNKMCPCLSWGTTCQDDKQQTS